MILAAVSHEDPSQRIHVQVADLPVRIGRNPELPADQSFVALKIPWLDRVVNRDHSIAHLQDDRIVIERLPAQPERNRGAPNPFYSNAPMENRVKLDDPLQLSPGDSFVIGAQGRTTFFCLRSLDDLQRMLESDSAQGEPRHRDFHRNEDAAVDYGDVAELDEYSMRFQLKLLQRELPEKVLTGWTEEKELFTKASDFLQSALPGQKGVSVAFLALCRDDSEMPFQVLHTNTSSRADFRPSRTLVRQIIDEEIRPGQTHIWSSEENYADLTGTSFVAQVDWVVAIPLSSLEKGAAIYHDSKGRPVFLYVETRQASNVSARVFVPFLRLVSSIVSSLLSARQKQQIQDRMSAYFSPALRRHFREGDEEALALTTANCTVLFCDRRASSLALEQAHSDEEILETLRDNQAFVSEITQIIFDHNGVITDFAGDGVLALWGWPRSEASASHAVEAVETAEAIARQLAGRLEFNSDSPTGIAAFRIGISTGRIAVGKTGPRQQMHISCFGSVVNFGARLEGLGKQFHVPVLLSEETSKLIQDQGKRVRELCYIRPSGFENAYPIFELVLPREEGGSGATPAHIRIYEEALHNFLQRQWSICRDLLGKLPSQDEPARWLEKQASYFLAHEPPPDWAGEIVSLVK